MDTREFLQSVLLELASRASQGAAYESWSDDFARKEVRETWADLEAPLRKQRQRKVTVAELRAVPTADLRAMGFASWDGKLTLIPLWAIKHIADGEVLRCINGDRALTGKDELDLDVRVGCIAYGFVADPDNVVEAAR